MLLSAESRHLKDSETVTVQPKFTEAAAKDENYTSHLEKHCNEFPVTFGMFLQPR